MKASAILRGSLDHLVLPGEIAQKHAELTLAGAVHKPWALVRACEVAYRKERYLCFAVEAFCKKARIGDDTLTSLEYAIERELGNCISMEAYLHGVDPRFVNIPVRCWSVEHMQWCQTERLALAARMIEKFTKQGN